MYMEDGAKDILNDRKYVFLLGSYDNYLRQLQALFHALTFWQRTHQSFRLHIEYWMTISASVSPLMSPLSSTVCDISDSGALSQHPLYLTIAYVIFRNNSTYRPNHLNRRSSQIALGAIHVPTYTPCHHFQRNATAAVSDISLQLRHLRFFPECHDLGCRLGYFCCVLNHPVSKHFPEYRDTTHE